MTPSLVPFLLTTSSLILLYRLFKRLSSPLRRLPSPDQGLWHKRFLTEPDSYQCEKWIQKIPNNGLIRYYGILGTERLLVTSPEGIKDILQLAAYEFEKTQASRILLQGILGDGLITAEQQNHKNQRKMLQPAFRFKMIKDSYAAFWKESLHFIDNLSHITEGVERVNIIPLLNHLSLDIVGKVGFGVDFMSVADPDNELNRQYNVAFLPSKSAQRRRLLALLLPSWLLNALPLKRNRELRVAIHTIRKAIANMISERKSDQQSGKTPPPDILGTIMSSGVQDSQALTNQCMTFLGAGQDTSASSLGWTAFELSRSPKIQERIRQEVRSSIPSPNDLSKESAPTVFDKLKFTKAVVSETLRLHPPVQMIRKTSQQTVTVSGVVCPKGTTFVISPWAMSHSREQWSEDPMKFDPDRWLSDATGGATDLYSFSTFSHGPRACIGEGFARAEMLAAIAALIGRYAVDFVGTGESVNPNPDEISVEMGTVTKIEGGLHVRLERVPGW